MSDNLTDALSRIMGKLGHLDKSGTAPAAMGGFKFVPETAVMNALQPLLVEERIMLLPRVKLLAMDEYVTGGGTKMRMATVQLELWARRARTTNALKNEIELEELLLATALGQGADTQDKAVGKATTGAKKQALLIAFAVPTGDDPDASAVDDSGRRTGGSRSRPRAGAGSRAETAPSSGSGPRRPKLVRRITELMAEVEEAGRKDLNRYSVREHIRKTYPPIETLTHLLQKATEDQLVELGTYLKAKLAEKPDQPAEKRAEDMSAEEALAAGTALLEGRQGNAPE